LESNWRGLAWDMNFMPSDIIMTARVQTGFFAGLWVAYQPNPTSAAWMFNVSPTTFPSFVTFAPRNTPHFPYGYDVDPD
jgi:hypothetical protein